MRRKRFIAGLGFGVAMFIFTLILRYASVDEPKDVFIKLYLPRAMIAGVVSGAIYGTFFGQSTKQKIE
ncbi:MAG: hypothetical protein Q7T76_13195 [Ferruginibacter sp.]|nr:hypothetical protein [Ferruginibacter sp.]